MPKVSIIIRSHNDIAFIEQTMQAILQQNYQDFELSMLITDQLTEPGSYMPYESERGKISGSRLHTRQGIK